MDRFFRGLVAGIIGGIVMNIWSLSSYYIFNFTDIRFVDWSSIFIFGDRPGNNLEFVMALIAQLLWSGFLGIILAYLIPLITSRGYLLKGAFFGFITGFIMYAVPVLFKVQYLHQISTATALSNMIGGILWGLTTALFLRLFDNKPLY